MTAIMWVYVCVCVCVYIYIYIYIYILILKILQTNVSIWSAFFPLTSDQFFPASKTQELEASVKKYVLHVRRV